MRRFFKFVAGLVLILVVAAIAAFFMIDWLAKKGVEKGGAYALGVETHVKDMDVGLLAGKCSLDGLNIANPSGFKSRDFLEVRHGDMAVDLKTLFSETVLVPTIVMDGIGLSLERAGTRSNYSVILENLRKLQSGEAPKEQKGKKYKVGEINLREIRVRVDVLGLPGQLQGQLPGELGKETGPIELLIPEIHLTDVGSETGSGVLISDVFAVVIRRILDEVAKQGAGQIPPDMLADLNQNLDRVRDGLKIGPDVLKQPEGAPGKIFERGKDLIPLPRPTPGQPPRTDGQSR